MAKVIIDVGHDGSDSGAVGGGFKEVDLNISIANYCEKELTRHGVVVKKTTGSLSARTSVENSWRPDYFVSIHINAAGGDGTEIYTYNGKGKGYEVASKIYNEIVPKLNNGRGLKTANFYVLKHTLGPACLVECAFIDSKDLECIDEQHERKAFGVAIAKGLLKQLSIPYKEESTPTPSTGSVYRVIVDNAQIGAYSVKENIAKEVVNAIDKKASKIEVIKK